MEEGGNEGEREENKAKGMVGNGRKKEKAKKGGAKKKLDDQNFVSILQSSTEWPGLELTYRDCIRVGYV